MSQVAFDTLAFANRLRASGMEQKQAEAQAEAQAGLLSDMVNNKLATKDDVKREISELRHELKSDIAELRHELKSDIAELRHEVKTEIAELRQEVKSDVAKLWVGLENLKTDLGKQIHNSMIAGVGVLATLTTFFHFLK
jgi:dsDNA-specific endonuclease/ATPase MutS2